METKKNGRGELELKRGHIMINNGVEQPHRGNGGVDVGCIIKEGNRK